MVTYLTLSPARKPVSHLRSLLRLVWRIYMGCVALKQFGGWQVGSGGSAPGEEKKRKVILDPMYNFPERRSYSWLFLPCPKSKRSTLRGTHQKILVMKSRIHIANETHAVPRR